MSPKVLQVYNKFMGYLDLVHFDKLIVGDLQQRELSRNGTNKDSLVYWISWLRMTAWHGIKNPVFLIECQQLLQQLQHFQNCIIL